MKQFLRYQVSGTVFIFWVSVFYYGQCAENLHDLIIYLQPKLKDIKIIASLLAIALPSGVLIHQFSVLIKNLIGFIIWKEFKDFPQEEIILNLDDKEKSTQYCLERISNLNSFYYVRFDNGLLSPFIAWLVVAYFMERNINSIWLLAAFIIGIITIIYLPVIYFEIKAYRKILSNKSNIYLQPNLIKVSSRQIKASYFLLFAKKFATFICRLCSR